MVSIASVSIFTHLFTAQSYGIYALATASIGIAVPLLSQWVAQPVGRYWAEYSEHQETAQFVQAVSSAAGLIVYMWLVLLAAAFGFSQWVIGQLWHPFVLLGAAVVMVTHSIAAVVSPMLPAQFKVTAYTRWRIAGSVMALLFQLGLIALFGRHVSLILFGSALASAATLPWLLGMTGARLDLRVRNWQRPDLRAVLTRFWSYGGPMEVWFLSSSLLNSADRFVIQGYLGAVAVGVYTVNYNLVSRLTNLISGPANNASFPVLMRQWARPELGAARETMRSMTTAFVDIGIGLVGLVVVVARDVAAILLGPGFRSGYMVMAPVLAAGVVYAASNIGHKILEMGDLTRLMMADGMVAALANVILNIIVVPRYGYMAAAYVTLATYLIYGSLIYRQSRRVVPWDIDLGRLLWAVGAAVLGVFTARHWATFGSPWWGLFMGTAAFTVPYVAVLWVHWRLRLPKR